ncbi:MAG: CoA pyrophosphatase [Planctomycetia bacterium]|nr:CoA pyrophosphatase [Planctomycetia bacterium]
MLESHKQETADDQVPQLLATRLVAESRPKVCRTFETELSFGRHAGPAPATARPAAVLVLLYRADDGGWRLPLTVRPAHMPFHAGQISLPGGLIEAGETSDQAALRELDEELGIAAAGVTLLGRLAELYVYVSDFIVTPWVAAIEAPPVWRPNPREVAEVLELPLSVLLDPAAARETLRTMGGVSYRTPFIALGEHQIWGATSLILCALGNVLRELDRR